MGKCKKRTLCNKAASSYFMTREQAINNIFKSFNDNSTDGYKDAANIISMFGISAEELSEAGLPYENLRALDSIMGY